MTLWCYFCKYAQCVTMRNGSGAGIGAPECTNFVDKIIIFFRYKERQKEMPCIAPLFLNKFDD